MPRTAFAARAIATGLSTKSGQFGVAQVSNLPYRSASSLRMPRSTRRNGHGKALPIGNRRYSRLETCATSLSTAAAIAGCLLAFADLCEGQLPNSTTNVFVNFETAPVHPIALNPDRSVLAVCNLPDGKLEIFNAASARLEQIASVPVGIDPLSVHFRNADEAWVVNHISRSISVVDLPTLRVKATLDTLNTPEDVIFAGSPLR